MKGLKGTKGPSPTRGCLRGFVQRVPRAAAPPCQPRGRVPNMEKQPSQDARGPHVFAYLTDDQAQWLPATERDTIALSVRAALA